MYECDDETDNEVWVRSWYMRMLVMYKYGSGV